MTVNHLYCKSVMINVFLGLMIIMMFLCYCFKGLLSKELGVKYCDTSACIKTANYINDNINKDIDPCENFYRFACGNFVKRTVLQDNDMVINTFSRLQEIVRSQLKDSIIESVTVDDEPETFNKLREYYKICIADEQNHEMNDGYMYGEEITYLEMLNKVGGWPVLIGDGWNEKNFSWHKTDAQLRKFGLADEFFINYAIGVDKKNNSVKYVHIAPATLGLDETFLTKDFEQKNVKAYYDYMINVAVFFGADRSRAEKELKESLTFEMRLADIILNATEKDEILRSREPVTIQKLQSMYPYVQWYDYFNDIFQPNVVLNETERIVVLAPVYFERLGALLHTTPKRVLANYIFWRTTKLVVHFLSKKTREIEHAYISTFKGNRTMTPRWEICFNQVLIYFPIAMGSLYVRTYVDPSTKGNVQEILSNIHDTFIEMIKEIKWMDDSTKTAALKKLNLMAAAVGYPEELLSNDKIDKYYHDVKIDRTSYFKTVINVNKFYKQRSLKSLRKPEIKKDWTDVFGAAATINAFYKFQANIMTIPSGIMQDFLYHNDHPKYLNYATLGSVIGHEITHGFDNVGRFFNEYGNRFDWWTNRTEKEFLEKSKCFVEQYSSYTVQEVNANVYGEKTLDENIADNIGLKGAYRAYIKWLKETGATDEPRLRRLEEYTTRQMFWIAFANTWCEKSRVKLLSSTVRYDPHAPNEFRVVGPVSNSAEFARDFHCSANSKMNPRRKCSIL